MRVPQHPHRLDRHQRTAGQHLVEDRQQTVDVLLIVHDFNQDGQVGRQLDQIGRVNDAVRA